MEDNNKLKDQIKLKIAISEIDDEENDMVMKSKKNYITKKIGIAACLVFTLTGVVFAKDIENFVKAKFGLGKGIETAVENGYIENPEMNFIESQTLITNKNEENLVNDINASIRVKDFLMDDYNLSVEFEIQFDDEIKEFVNLDNLHYIELSDLIVVDEEKRIIFNGANQEDFEKFCEENNLDYKYQEFNDNYMNNGLNTFLVSHDTETNLLTFTYNMYAEGYPKSKQLDFSFEKIKMTENDNNNEVVFNGNWEIHLDVPEKMYNRSEEHYKVISCENEDFNIYTAKVTDTGLEIGITISNMEKPEKPQELAQRERELNENGSYSFGTKEEFLALYGDEKYLKLYEEYRAKSKPINVTGITYAWGTPTDGCYVLDSNGNKFKSTMSPSRKAHLDFIDGNKFDFYETFGMTKYDSTDEITVVIDFYGQPVKIELEKIK